MDARSFRRTLSATWWAFPHRTRSSSSSADQLPPVALPEPELLGDVPCLEVLLWPACVPPPFRQELLELLELLVLSLPALVPPEPEPLFAPELESVGAVLVLVLEVEMAAAVAAALPCDGSIPAACVTM